MSIVLFIDVNRPVIDVIVLSLGGIYIYAPGHFYLRRSQLNCQRLDVSRGDRTFEQCKRSVSGNNHTCTSTDTLIHVRAERDFWTGPKADHSNSHKIPVTLVSR